MRMRMYAPWDELTFPNEIVYEIHPPIGKSGEWVYIHKEGTA
jgi:hypothetical protein